MEWLNDMALFVEVARAKGFGKAADKLGLATSTLSVRISRLEQHIGLQLLNRTTRRVELTDAGRLYYDKAARIVEEARLAHQQLDELLAEPTGVLNITMPVEFGQLFIAPLMAEFSLRYPGIVFELNLEQQKQDLLAASFDLAIRIGPQPDSALITRLLTRVGGGLYASPAYLAAHGTPQRIEEVSQHQVLRFRHGFGETWALFNGDTRIELPIQGRFQTNSPGMNARLAAAGLGITLLPHIIVQAEVASGALQRILPEWHSQPVPVYAVTTTRLLPAKVRAFIDFLQENLPTPPAG